MIEFGCKNCGRKLNVEDKHSGKRVKCPKCGNVGVVPDNSTKIKFHCKSCGQSISVPQIHAGKKGKCPKCKNPVVVPSVKREPAEGAETFSIVCSMCDETIQVPETSRGQAIECPACGSYMEASSWSGPPGSAASVPSVPSGTDEDRYEEESDVSEEGTGVDRRLILVISGVAAVVVVGLVILVTVILPSGSRQVEELVIVPLEPHVEPDRGPERPVVAAEEPVEAAPLPKPGEVVTNSIGMKLIYIPAGSFMMGSSRQHQVRISEGFWMGQTEVTQGQYKSVMNTQPWSGKGFVQESTNNPAVYVSWDDAVEFCRKLSQQEGKTYRLPTEAEWEYACRAGTTTQFSFGDSDSSLGDYAWFFNNTLKVDEKYAHAVGQKKANPWGLYDMHGNVSEWCSDWYDEDEDSRSWRGGSWYNLRGNLRSFDRLKIDVPGYRSNYIGFRVVRSQLISPPGPHVEPDKEPTRQEVGDTDLRPQPATSETQPTELIVQESPPKPSSLGSEPRVKLRQKFPPGKYEVIQTETQKSVQTVEGRTVTTNESRSKWYEVDASEPNASGQTTCIATMKRIKSTDPQGLSYDTDDPDSLRANELGQIMSKIMLNQKFVFKFGQDGKLVSVSGLDRLWDSISNGVSSEVAKANPKTAKRAAQISQIVVRQLKQEADVMGNKGYIKSILGLIYDIMPDQPVGVGAVWHKVISEKTPFIGAAKISAEYELGEIEQISDGKIAHITCVGSIKQDQSKRTQFGPMSMTFNKTDLRQKGEIQLNADTGLMISSRMEVDGELEVSMNARGRNVATNFQISHTTETTTKPVIDNWQSKESVPEPIVQEPAKEYTPPIEPIVKETREGDVSPQEPVSLEDKLPGQTKIVFTSGKSKTGDIFIMNADGSELKNLTNNPARNEIPCFSPDGTKIAFTSNRDGERNTEIYVMNADGSESINLTNNPAKDSYPSWSPAGEKIAFTSLRDRKPGIYIMNADGSEQTRLTTEMDFYPSWSTDGAKIAFTSYRGTERKVEIYVMNADGSEQTRLTNNSARDLYPCWSPDGTKIAFTSYRDGQRNSEIYIMNADGSEPINLTSNPNWDIHPSWSPDGKKIAFSSNRDRSNEIYIMNADGSGVKRLTYIPASDTFPSWSPYIPPTKPIVQESPK